MISPRLGTAPRRHLAVAAAAAVIAATLGGAALAAGSNLIFNGSFQRRLSGWTVVVVAKGTTPGYPHVSASHTPSEPELKCERYQRGHSFLQIDVASGASAYVEQSVIVPVNPGRLTFRTWAAVNPVKAAISIVDGPFFHRLATYEPPTLLATPARCSGSKPIIESIDMAPYAGQAVGLRIRATARSTEPASADFTNVELTER